MNINIQEKQALKQLTDNTTIAIKPADKRREYCPYVALCNKILRNKKWYRKITTNIVEKCNKEYYQLVDLAYFNNVIKKNQL